MAAPQRRLERLITALRRVLLTCCALPALGAGVALAWCGHLVAVAPLGIGALLVAAVPAHGRRSGVLFALAVAVTVTFFAVRVATVTSAPAWLVCDGAACTSTGPWWSRLLPEQPSADVGFLGSTLLGITHVDEAAGYRRAFDEQLRALPDVPNAAVLSSTATLNRRIVVEPPGTGALPAVIFLHGFGGLSSAYPAVLDQALDHRAIIVAPALDVGARWDSPRGRAVVEQTLASLPSRVDRRRLVLMGVSNGAIFGATYSSLFRGAVLVSGVGDLQRGPVWVVTGRRDLRVQVGAVREVVETLKADGADVTLDVVDDADHALLFTHQRAWVRRVLPLLAPD